MYIMPIAYCTWWEPRCAGAGGLWVYSRCPGLVYSRAPQGWCTHGAWIHHPLGKTGPSHVAAGRTGSRQWPRPALGHWVACAPPISRMGTDRGRIGRIGTCALPYIDKFQQILTNIEKYWPISTNINKILTKLLKTSLLSKGHVEKLKSVVR